MYIHRGRAPAQYPNPQLPSHMPSPRQMVITTLKDLTRECLREQSRLHFVLRSKAVIEAREREIRGRIKGIKLRVNRELTAHKEMLGVGPALDWDDGDGEEWKDRG